MEWEQVNCEYCGSDKSTLYLESPIPNWYEGKEIRLVECDKCELIYANPRPIESDLYRRFMTDSPFAKTITERKRARKNVGEVHNHVIDEVMEYHPTAQSLFDFGCGAGTLIEAASERGLKAGGNDLNWYSTEQLKKAGFDVRKCFNAEVDTTAKYDVATMLDVLEHSFTPNVDLNVAYDLLSDDGLLFAKTLYIGSPRHQADGEAWPLFGQGHFHYFKPDVLRQMIESAGFEILHSREAALIRIIARKRTSS